VIVDPKNGRESERDVLKRLTSLIKKTRSRRHRGAQFVPVRICRIWLRGRASESEADWGRSGGFLRSRPSRLQIAEKTIDYPKFAIEGRHFVDMFCSPNSTTSECEPIRIRARRRCTAFRFLVTAKNSLR